MLALGLFCCFQLSKINSRVTVQLYLITLADKASCVFKRKVHRLNSPKAYFYAFTHIHKHARITKIITSFKIKYRLST